MRTRSKRLTGLVAVAAASLLAFAGCNSGGGGGGNNNTGGGSVGYADCDKNPNTCNGGKTKAGGEYLFALEQEFTNWNTSSDEGNTLVGGQALANIIPAVWKVFPDGLFTLNKDLMVSAEVTNQSPQTVVYKIRPEAVWNDGTPISADDFIFAWKQSSGKPEHCSAACVPASTSGYELIKSIVGSDNGKTVTVTFEDGKKYPDWKALWGTDGLYPAHVLTKQGFDLSKPEGVGAAHEWLGKTPPTWSGGAYLIESFNKGQNIVEVKNPKWYGATKPSLDKLVFKFLTEQGSIVPALRNREILGADPQTNADLVTQVSQTPGVIYRIGHGYQWEHIDLNLKNKYLADAALRKAIFTAINVKTIIDKTYGVFDKAAKPLGSHNFFPGDQNYKDVVTATGQGSGDATAAKKILTDAGYKIEGGKLIAKTGEPVPSLRFRHTKGNALRATTAELVQAQLKEIGIDMKIEITETLGKTLSSGDFDLMIFAWVGSPAYRGALEQNWRTGGGGNYGKYSNKQVDDLITQAAQEFDAKKAADLTNQLDELMTKDAYVLPIAQKPTMILTYQEWANVRDNASQFGPNYNNHEWGLRATGA
jgi:peptide/nickel transport system substrate-binding protein